MINRLITREVDYAIRILVYMYKSDSDLFTADSLKEATDIPLAFIRKITQKLAKGGFISSIKGKNGGLKLVKKADSITVFELIIFLQGKISFTECTFLNHPCQRMESCKLRLKLDEFEGLLINQFKEINISSIL